MKISALRAEGVGGNGCRGPFTRIGSRSDRPAVSIATDAPTNNTQPDNNIYHDGGIIRTDPSVKHIDFVFTAADKADGAERIISTLRKYNIKGGFFFTGEFFEMYPDVVRRLVAEATLRRKPLLRPPALRPLGQP